MFDHQTAEQIRSDLLAAMVASNLFARIRQTVLAPRLGKTMTKEEPETDFEERLRNLTIVLTDKQTFEFTRHGFTTVAVPLDGFNTQVIDLNSLTSAQEPSVPRFAWFNHLRNNGVLIGISSGKQPVPASKPILELEQPEDVMGLTVRFYTRANEHKTPPYNPELSLLYRADYYQTGPFRGGTGNQPPSLLITSHLNPANPARNSK